MPDVEQDLDIQSIFVIRLCPKEQPLGVRACLSEETALAVSHVTRRCWYLETVPDGMPERLHMPDEYTVQHNKNGIYAFGRDADRLRDAWNSFMTVPAPV